MKKLCRLMFISLGVYAAGVTNVLAQEYPTKPVTFIVPYAAGGPVDGNSRVVAEYLSRLWKQPVVVMNKPGAGGSTGVVALAHSAPDGYTLMLTGTAIAAFKTLMKNPGVDVERDLAPISLVGVGPLVIMVNSQIPVKSLSEFISYARARPDKLNYGSSSALTTLLIEAFNQLAGIDTVRVVYSGEAPNALALSRGDVQMSVFSLNAAVPLLQTGKGNALARIFHE